MKATRSARSLVVLLVGSIPPGFALGAERPALAQVLREAPADVVVNVEGNTYDSKPSLAVSGAEESGAWEVWGDEADPSVATRPPWFNRLLISSTSPSLREALDEPSGKAGSCGESSGGACSDDDCSSGGSICSGSAG